MLLKTLLNRIEKHKSFIYKKIHFGLVKNEEALIVEIKARKNSKAKCPKCGVKASTL